MIEVYTDGSAAIKDKSGGWAFAFVDPRQERDRFDVVRYGATRPSTVNEMELTAIHNAMALMVRMSLEFTILTDSLYSLKSITTWRCIREETTITGTGAPAANMDLIRKCWALHDAAGNPAINHVKGHAGVRLNEVADYWAGHARRHHITNWKPTT